MTWTLEELVRAIAGEVLQVGVGPFTGVSTDSRRIAPGEIFVALQGPRFDGHEFVTEACERGATAAVVSRPLPPVRRDVTWIRVGDTLRALGNLAAARRRRLPTRIVAVTGSNGKTTTKEMIASALAATGKKVAKTRGTENNLVGLPMTVLGLDGDEDYVVLEMGMNRRGEIARLTEIARPDVGVITNVGPAHLEGVGTLADVAAAKGELATVMDARATLVVPAGDPWLEPIAARFSGRTLRAGPGGTVRATGVHAVAGDQQLDLEIEGSREPLLLHCLGAHNVENALLAAAATLALGVELRTIAAGLQRFTPPPMRLELVRLQSGARVLNDAYNANPASMAAALASLGAEPAKRRIAILGEMLELGSEAAAFHREVGRTAAQTPVDRFIAVGRYGREMVEGALEGGLAGELAAAVESAAEAGRLLAGSLGEGDLILVKGSRGARMEDVIQHLDA